MAAASSEASVTSSAAPVASAMPAKSVADALATPADQSVAAPQAAVASVGAPVVDTTRVAYLVRVKRPTFTAMSVGTAEFGVIGVLAEMSIGDQIIADNKVDDPANVLAAQVAALYAADHGGLTVDAPLVVGEHQTLNDFPDLKARYVVVASTLNWGYLYFPFDWTHYGVMYGADLAVLDRVTNTDVLKARCFVRPVKQGAPNHDALLSNGAAGLKALLVTAGQTCLTQMQAKTPELKSPAG